MTRNHADYEYHTQDRSAQSASWMVPAPVRIQVRRNWFRRLIIWIAGF